MVFQSTIGATRRERRGKRCGQKKKKTVRRDLLMSSRERQRIAHLSVAIALDAIFQSLRGLTPMPIENVARRAVLSLAMRSMWFRCPQGTTPLLFLLPSSYSRTVPCSIFHTTALVPTIAAVSGDSTLTPMPTQPVESHCGHDKRNVNEFEASRSLSSTPPCFHPMKSAPSGEVQLRGHAAPSLYDDAGMVGAGVGAGTSGIGV